MTMTMTLASAACFFLLLTLVISPSAAQQEHDEKAAAASSAVTKHPGVVLAEAQVDWLRSHGGFFSEKISIMPLFESNSATVPLGLFTNQHVTKGETLMQIPVECLLTTGLDDSEDMCDTAINLVRQRQLGEKSFYEPYVSYMYSKTRIQLPSNWSPEGRKLLLQIRGALLPPQDLTQVSFANHCSDHDHVMMDTQQEQGYDPQELEFAYLTVVSRAWSHVLVPVFDMINHHSGRYANVDSTSIHDEDVDKVTAFATKDVPAGQQIFLSYMDCIDEKGFELEYVLPQLLRDFGYVDDYPQRWTFPRPTFSNLPKKNQQQAWADDDNNFVFEIDFINEEMDALFKVGAIQGPPKMKITWLTGEPSEHQLLFFKDELKRIEMLQPNVIQQAEQLQDDYERKVALDYYNSLAMVLQYATGNVTRQQQQQQESCDSNDPGGLSGLVHSEDVRNFPPPPPPPDTDKSNQQPSTSDNPEGSSPQDWMACNDYWKIEDTYETIDESPSFYQSSTFLYHQKDDDVCLYMDGYLHACASSRPHYHEVFVHYAARFIGQVQRVLFIGGGDSMVLHEVLKYPSLQMVVGLELDHKVVRASFKNFGTQPHWDNDKVHWYFGDAAKR
jgi:Spermine/spermidine synthase domain/SET domain